MLTRLDKALRDAMPGSSRTETAHSIRQGRISVNGEICRLPDRKIDPEYDRVELDGHTVVCRRFWHIMLYKPAGYLSATEDKHDPTVMELLPPEYRNIGLSPAGRLDKDTEGLLILTSDGQLLHDLISPARHVPKTYYAKLKNPLAEDDVCAFRAGVCIDGGYVCLPAALEVLEGSRQALVTIYEGKFHQVKRMFAACVNEVLYLKRLSIGEIKLDESLKKGGWRLLTDEEIHLLYAQKQDKRQ